MSFNNLLVPNNLNLFCNDISINGSIESGNESSAQIYGTVITTTTSVTTASEYPLSNGNYILVLYVNALTTAGTNVGGGLSQIARYWLNVAAGLLTTTSIDEIHNRYVYPDNATVLSSSIINDPINQNVLQINVQNAFTGNTTKWTVVAQIYGLSTTNF